MGVGRELGRPVPGVEVTGGIPLVTYNSTCCVLFGCLYFVIIAGIKSN